MARTLADLMAELNECRHQQQIYMELVNFLSTFVDDEVQRAERSMVTDGLGRVPTELVQQAIDVLNEERIDPLTEKIESIQAIDVEVPNDTKPKRKKAGTRRKPKGNGESKKGLALPTGPRQVRHRGTSDESCGAATNNCRWSYYHLE